MAATLASLSRRKDSPPQQRRHQHDETLDQEDGEVDEDGLFVEAASHTMGAAATTYNNHGWDSAGRKRLRSPSHRHSRTVPKSEPHSTQLSLTAAVPVQRRPSSSELHHHSNGNNNHRPHQGIHRNNNRMCNNNNRNRAAPQPQPQQQYSRGENKFNQETSCSVDHYGGQPSGRNDRGQYGQKQQSHRDGRESFSPRGNSQTLAFSRQPARNEQEPSSNQFPNYGQREDRKHVNHSSTSRTEEETQRRISPNSERYDRRSPSESGGATRAAGLPPSRFEPAPHVNSSTPQKDYHYSGKGEESKKLPFERMISNGGRQSDKDSYYQRQEDKDSYFRKPQHRLSLDSRGSADSRRQQHSYESKSTERLQHRSIIDSRAGSENELSQQDRFAAPRNNCHVGSPEDGGYYSGRPQHRSSLDSRSSADSRMHGRMPQGQYSSSSHSEMQGSYTGRPQHTSGSPEQKGRSTMMEERGSLSHHGLGRREKGNFPMLSQHRSSLESHSSVNSNSHRVQDQYSPSRYSSSRVDESQRLDGRFTVDSRSQIPQHRGSLDSRSSVDSRSHRSSYSQTKTEKKTSNMDLSIKKKQFSQGSQFGQRFLPTKPQRSCLDSTSPVELDRNSHRRLSGSSLHDASSQNRSYYRSGLDSAPSFESQGTNVPKPSEPQHHSPSNLQAQPRTDQQFTMDQELELNSHDGKRLADQISSLETERPSEHRRRSSPPPKKRWCDEIDRLSFSHEMQTLPGSQVDSNPVNLGTRWCPPESPQNAATATANNNTYSHDRHLSKEETPNQYQMDDTSVDVESSMTDQPSRATTACSSIEKGSARQELIWQKPNLLTDAVTIISLKDEKMGSLMSIGSKAGLSSSFTQQSTSSVGASSVVPSGNQSKPQIQSTATILSSAVTPQQQSAKVSAKGSLRSKPMKSDPAAAKKVNEMKKSDLGIPLRWLKPAAKPKKTVKQVLKGSVSLKKENSVPLPGAAKKASGVLEMPLFQGGNPNSSRSRKDGAIGSKRGVLEQSSTGNKKRPRPASPPLNLMVTDSEGGSTVSNNRDLRAMLTEKRHEECIPSAIVTKPNPPKDVDKSEKREELFFLGSPTESHGLPASPNIDNAEDEDAKPVADPLKSLRKRKIDADSSQVTADSASDSDTSSSSDSSSSSSSDESDTDDEEVMMWASKMFGVPFRSQMADPTSHPNSDRGDDEQRKDDSPTKGFKLHIRLPPKKAQPNAAELQTDGSRLTIRKKKKLKKFLRESLSDVMKSEQTASVIGTVVARKKHKKKKKKKKEFVVENEVHEKPEELDEEKMRLGREEARRKKEAAKPLTMSQIRAILGEDGYSGAEGGGANWVRRSVRQPSKSLLHSKPLKCLVKQLKSNHQDMTVLKTKKYINDPNAPQVVIDAALDALEENMNCEVLYIQNFNEGMRDKQVLQLLKILQQPSCRIWCMNIGENYNVETETWDQFTQGLRKTKVTHMYASEHTITTEMKDDIRATIRENRKKHDMHINPNNLSVIVQCTHCWWNPVNAKALRPYLKKKGYEHMLYDKEVQGLRGSSSAAPVT